MMRDDDARDTIYADALMSIQQICESARAGRHSYTLQSLEADLRRLCSDAPITLLLRAAPGPPYHLRWQAEAHQMGGAVVAAARGATVPDALAQLVVDLASRTD